MHHDYNCLNWYTHIYTYSIFSIMHIITSVVFDYMALWNWYNIVQDDVPLKYYYDSCVHLRKCVISFYLWLINHELSTPVDHYPHFIHIFAWFVRIVDIIFLAAAVWYDLFRIIWRQILYISACTRSSYQTLCASK